MPLDKTKLSSLLKDVFDSFPKSTSEAAQKITDAIVLYMNDAQLNPPIPGINQAGVPDPVASLPLNPVNVDIGAVQLKSAIEASMNIKTSIWAEASSGFASYLATLVTWSDSVGYIATGTIASSPILFNVAFALGQNGNSSIDVANKLADLINIAVTSSVFTGTYLHGPFVGVTPHVSNII